MKITPLKENLEEVVEASKSVLEAGGVILYPTDTVYGLGADVANQSAVSVIYGIKERSPRKPFLIMVNGIEMLKKYAEVNSLAEHFIQKFWPGALTLVLKCYDENLCAVVGSTDGKVGFRMPKHPFCLELLKKYPHPIISTSANISGEAQPANVNKILEQLASRAQKIDLVVDGGTVSDNTPSTIIDVADGALKIVRKGAVEI